MKKILFILLLLSLASFSQEKVTVSGTVYDNINNETLIGVSVYFPELKAGTTTNEYGFYSITIPKGTYKMQISYLGYATILESISLETKTTKNFKIKEETASLNEIVIESNIERLNVKSPQMSVNKLTSATIKQIPVVLGEADIIKSILLLPGVTSAGEGASGFNVRLYKGGIPAKYGGRLSSVLDIYQKEGNSKDFKVTGGVGLISSRLLVEGPLKKEKSSFVVAGRSSYAHLFLPLFDNDNKAFFYDLNGKFNYRINQNNNLFVSTYFGKDVFGINDSFVNDYGNSVVNLRWNHLFSDKIFSNLSLIYSDYFYGLTLDFVGFEWDSGITNYNLKYDFKHYINNTIKLSYGVNNIYTKFNPGNIKPNRDEGIVANKLIDKYANELALYIDAEHEISESLKLQYGVRFSNFTRLGQDELNIYENNEAVIYNETLKKYESATAIGTENFKRSDVIKSFHNLEPRVSMAYTLNNNTSIKASYNRMSQYLHLLSNTASPTPLDVWAPSGKYIKPQLLDQFAVGYFKSIKDGDYSLETEAFYKNIKNRIDYINGANLIANNEIETVILNGKARAYGLEVLLKKNTGKIKGWFSYTLSRSEQLTPGRNQNEPGINGGEWYNTPYDKTHDFSLNASYELNKKWTFNSNFLFQTGQPTNFPVAQYQVQGLTVPLFENNRRNADRLPSYHRLDISATLTPEKNKNRKWQGEWVFGIYNIYNRENAASISFRENRETSKNEAVQTSIFGVVPSVTYNFKF